MAYAKFWEENNEPDRYSFQIHGTYDLLIETNNKQLTIYFKSDKHCESKQVTMRAFKRFDLVEPERMGGWADFEGWSELIEQRTKNRNSRLRAVQAEPIDPRVSWRVESLRTKRKPEWIQPRLRRE